MKITVDSFLKIGQYNHPVCEDYIIAGHDPVPYVILSDGCSSETNTDVGARLLVWAAKSYLSEMILKGNLSTIDEVEMGNWIIKRADATRVFLGLHKNCLVATLIIAYQYMDHVYVYMYGDGFVIYENESKEIYYHKTYFDNEMPYYLSYQINREADESYMRRGIKKHRIFHYRERIPVTLDLREGIIHKYSMKNKRYLLIGSDGLDSFFFSNNGVSIGDSAIIPKLVAFKNTNGSFVIRRVKRQIKDWAKEGIIHHDDISIGGFYIHRQ